MIVYAILYTLFGGMALVFVIFFIDWIATNHYYKWWVKYGSDDALRIKYNLPRKKIPKEPWFGRWGFR